MKLDLRRRRTGRPRRTARALDHAAVVPQVPFVIEHRHVEPAVVGPKPGRPDDRPDLAARADRAAAATTPARGSARSAPAAPTSASRACARAHSSKVSSSRSIFRSASANMIAQPAREERAAVAHRRQPADELDADRAERVEIQRRALRRADELRRRQPPRARQVVDLVVALVPHAGGVHPPQHVAAAIGPRQPHVLADRERHRPAGAVDLVGELHAGGRRADDQHAAVGQLARIAVVERRELRDGRRHGLREAPARWARCRRRSPAPRSGSEGRRCWWRRDSRRRSRVTDVTVVCVRTGARGDARRSAR